MAITDLPAGVRFSSRAWAQSGGVIYQRSDFTAKTRALRLGPAARWRCEVQLIPDGTQAGLQAVRAWLATMAQPANGFRLPAVEVAQAGSPVPATCLVNGAGQLGFSLAVDGLPNSTPILPAGALVSVALGSTDEQLFVLLAAASSNGSGQATLSLNEPLRAAPADNAVVRLHLPVAVMRLESAVSWQAAPAPIYSFPSFTAVEFA